MIHSAAASASSAGAYAAGNPHAAAVAHQQPASTASAFANGDFDTFLRMLTTQIKHQDPLNPMDGADFAVQLATFSGVEQQVRTNQLLETLAGGNSGGLARIAGWLGTEVRTTAPVAFDGTPLTLDIQPERGADAVTLITRDASGREVLRESIGTGNGEVDWAGKKADGSPLASGRYSFRIESMKGGEILSTINVGTYARVTGAELTAQGIRLTLPGGASTLESQITAVRERH